LKQVYTMMYGQNNIKLSNNQFLSTDAVLSARKEINFYISPRLTASFKRLYTEYPKWSFTC